MRTRNPEAGFTLVELLTSTTISLIVIGTAMTAFKDGVGVNNTVANLADASQNLRSGMNFLVRDLQSAGRLIPTGGIPIPNGPGAGRILRPSPVGAPLYFDNVNSTTLTAIVSGAGLGPTVDNEATDMITMMTVDPILDACLLGPLVVNPNGTPGNVPVMAADGSSFSTGTNIGCLGAGATGSWLVGDATQGQSPLKKGDLILFTNPLGNAAIQTVTSVDATDVFFASTTDDWFGFNQRNVTAGSITQILGQSLSAQRVLMWTYYVNSVSGEPHLMRQLNNFSPQALAGVVEDLDLSYDLVDGVVNPVFVKSLPYTLNGNTYSASQIRKVNVHVGVRSEAMATKQHDYLRSHVSTVVSVRSLAFVDRYK